MMFISFFKNILFSSVSILALSLLILQTVQAAEPAHEHGVGRILIAFEGQDVEIELSIPGADAVGFEHTASSEEEKMAISAAAKALRDVDRIIRLSSEAMCRAEEIEVVSGLMEDEKVESGQSHEHEDAVEEVHSEFIAQYHFHCEQPSKMTGAEIGFFSVFPSAHELEAEWITPRGQGAAELTAKSPNLAF